MFLLGEIMNYLFYDEQNLSKDNAALFNQLFEGKDCNVFPLSVSDSLTYSPLITEKLTVVLGLKYNNIAKDFLVFLETLEKQNATVLNVDVIFVCKRTDDSKFAVSWLNQLSQDKVFMLNILGEFDAENLAGDAETLAKVLNVNKYKAQKKVKVDNTQVANHITIYTDGACSGNPGAGGWGAILMTDNKQKEISGFDPSTTNNKMELTAVIVALEQLKQPCNVELYSDSAYVVNALLQGWLENWKKNGWKGADKKPVKNIDLWQRLDYLLTIHNVSFNKVKGHADNPYNNRCDELATGEIAQHANQE